MMPPASSRHIRSFVVGSEVARLGRYVLFWVNDDYYQLAGPDAGYSRAWLMATLPPGDWFTRWSGDPDELVVHITR